MRKALVAVAVVAMVASAAFAGVLVVPKYNDGGGSVNSSFFPPTLNATYISVHNASTSAKTITVNYYAIDGTPQGTATASIPAHGIADWRPTLESNSPTKGLSTSSAGLGSATITYDSSDGKEMAGRAFVNAAATSSSVSFSLVSVPE